MTESGKGRNPHRLGIAQQLRSDIISGRYRTGERLVEETLADTYGVSRVPVREALRRLESEGFVVLTPYRGATVASWSQRDRFELVQVRRGLEVFAARLAAEARGGAVRDELLAVVARERQGNQEHQSSDLPELAMRFHELVAKASGNRQLETMIDRVIERRAWEFEEDIESRLGTEGMAHAAIADAIVNGSPVQAGYLMDEHLSGSEADLRAEFGSELDAN